MIRSSGESETLQNRGQLVSRACLSVNIVSTIRSLFPELQHSSSENIHWVVQQHIGCKAKGHLSNERHVKREKRDWLAEIETREGRLGYTIPIAVRPWRDGKDLPDLHLRCQTELQFAKSLKPIAMWATQLAARTHFEWVWDGMSIRVVQAEADVAEHKTGSKPRALLPNQIASIEDKDLRVFLIANSNDYTQYRKLRNANLYNKFGYKMPAFYKLDNPDVIKSILSGEIEPSLEYDLTLLTKRPLIIRTDGLSIPAGKREMLPRSDELRTAEDAITWIQGEFKRKIHELELEGSGLCLIAHHFIPSVASAWARAIPGSRIVRIESLWGIPEGLYWYSHDTYEVDTHSTRLDQYSDLKDLEYTSSKRLRFKGHFIAPNEDGKWVPFQTMTPYDWGESVQKQQWLIEIAHTTRLVAEHEQDPVSVMWFIDNHPKATEHNVLPWYHSRSELISPRKAAPRRKRSSVSDFTLRSREDWLHLQKLLERGSRPERVVVEPLDVELIRNQEFTKELAGLAARHGFVVQLAGGILSHAYYMLQRAGAQVECVDLFGADEDLVEYNKVVRDKVPAYIEERGEHVETIELVGDALITALRRKIVEEAFEVLDAKSEEEVIEELADLQEVITGLCRALNVTGDRIEIERANKLKRRGGFDKGLMLISTATPHSIATQDPANDTPTLELQQLSEGTISNPANLPSKPIYRRPDLRHVDTQPEKLFTFETETNTLGEVKETLEFSMPKHSSTSTDFKLAVELRRKGASIRGIVRLRSLPSQASYPGETQLTLDFSE